MTLNDMLKKFIEEAKAGQIPEAMETFADLLKSSAGFYKLIFGGAAAAVEDLSWAEADLLALKAELAAHCSCAEQDGSCKQLAAFKAQANPNGVPPAVWLAILDVLLQLIAARKS